MEDSQTSYPDDAVVQRTEEPLSAEVDGEAVLLEPESGTYYGMNEVGSQVWAELDSPVTVVNLRSTLAVEFGIDTERAHEDLVEFLSELESSNLVEVETPSDAA